MKQQLDQAQDKPNDADAADRNFAEAVDAFGRGDYNEAVLKFRVAMVLDPKDSILPFAYAQALFAKGDYAAAAATLRSVLISISQPIQTGAQKDEGQETVYYPRGLYKKEDFSSSRSRLWRPRLRPTRMIRTCNCCWDINCSAAGRWTRP